MFNSQESQTSGFTQLLWNASHLLLYVCMKDHILNISSSASSK